MKDLNLSIITIFPELFRNFLLTGNLGRAVNTLNQENRIKTEIINFRDFGTGNYKQLDDYAFGSGGMLFAAPQLKNALDFAVQKSGAEKNFVLYPSPQGQLLNQELIESLSNQEHLIIICGHYEGIDERFVEHYVDLEFSIGDCVLTGGEIPAMVLIDALSRLVPGVVGKSNAVIEDSFYKGMLDNPHYTRPASWEGENVPEILLSGNKNEIQKWRRSIAVKRTLSRRSDLVSRAEIRDYISGGVFLTLISNENINPEIFTGIENLRALYGLQRPFLISKNKELREKFKTSGFKILGNFSKVLEALNNQALVFKIYSKPCRNSFHCLEAKRKILENIENSKNEKFDNAILFVLSNDESELENIDGISVYLQSDFNNTDLKLDLKTALTLDRILGKR